MNNVYLTGNLTKDSEARVTATGKQVTTFTLAVSTGKDDKKATAFIPIVAWDMSAKIAGEYKKGQNVFVSGRIATRSYENKDGKKVYVTEVIANETHAIQFVEIEKKADFTQFGEDAPF